MKRILDFDPLSGKTTYFDYESDSDRMHITEVQDVNAVLEQTSALRLSEDYSRKGIKQDQWHYCRIPDVIGMEIAQKFGVNIYGPKPDWKSFFKIINRDYPYLKATNKTHA